MSYNCPPSSAYSCDCTDILLIFCLLLSIMEREACKFSVITMDSDFYFVSFEILLLSAYMFVMTRSSEKLTPTIKKRTFIVSGRTRAAFSLRLIIPAMEARPSYITCPMPHELSGFPLGLLGICLIPSPMGVPESIPLIFSDDSLSPQCSSIFCQVIKGTFCRSMCNSFSPYSSL
jgi:hypothetical protein